MTTPLGEEKGKLTMDADGSVLKGNMEANGNSQPIFDGTVAGDKVAWKVNTTVPKPMTWISPARWMAMRADNCSDTNAPSIDSLHVHGKK
jgi:hypothetical protein